MSDYLSPYGLQPHQAPLSMGFSRQEYWSGLPCPPPGDLSHLGTEPVSFTFLHWQVGSSPLAPPSKPICWMYSVTGIMNFLPHPDAVNKGASRPFIFSSTFKMWSKEQQHRRLFCRCQRSTLEETWVCSPRHPLLSTSLCLLKMVFRKEMRKGTDEATWQRRSLQISSLFAAQNSWQVSRKIRAGIASWIMHAVSSLHSNIPSPSTR